MIVRDERQGHVIEELLSANGGEFNNIEVQEFLQHNVITQRLLALFGPEQNGGSERGNRTIVEMARTFIYSHPNIQYPDEIFLWKFLENPTKEDVTKVERVLRFTYSKNF